MANQITTFKQFYLQQVTLRKQDVQFLNLHEIRFELTGDGAVL